MKKLPILAAALATTWLLSASPANAKDRLDAAPTGSFEALSAASVKTRLIDKLGFEGLLITVSVAEKTATLTGEVEKPSSQRFAERVALSVKGIKSVDNKVTVGPEGKHCIGAASDISTLR